MRARRTGTPRGKPPRVGGETDARMMRRAISEALRAEGLTSPNPIVGAVVARGDAPVASAFHRKAGTAHAEVAVLRKCDDPSGATLYVTLEPCSTHGRTPPCTGAIIAAGIGRVVIGATDPNPRHAGRAVAILRSAGIEVTVGVLEKECEALNPGFNKWIVTGMPHVTAKAAMTLDGRLTRPPGESRWLSCPASRTDAHTLRARVDAILVGAGTVRSDNPRLTIRGIRKKKPQPWRVVVASHSGELPPDSHLFTDEHAGRTLVFRGKPLREILAELGSRQITSVLIEGGSRVLGEALDSQLIDAVRIYLTPWISGGPVPVIGGIGAASASDAPGIRHPVYRQCGPDLILSGELEYASPR